MGSVKSFGTNENIVRKLLCISDMKSGKAYSLGKNSKEIGYEPCLHLILKYLSCK